MAEKKNAGQIDNMRIFRNTVSMCKSDERLASSIRNSLEGQKLFLTEKDIVPERKEEREGSAEVIVSDKRCFEAARQYALEGKKVCVLNFASAVRPGGGVARGIRSPEARLCRCSTLYSLLDSEKLWHEYYFPHRLMENTIYNDDCIYTPDVTVFKNDDDFPSLMPENDWYNVNVLSCSPPDLRRMKVSDRMAEAFYSTEDYVILETELKELLKKRVRRIFEIAASYENDVFVAGAFGCGIYDNSPKITAKVFHEVQQDFLYSFETIEYAVYRSETNSANYDAFSKVLAWQI